jgi:3-hydroxymyristoyl/3-hydroxydecanoyl-(acyl carrier protein) dehydratase
MHFSLLDRCLALSEARVLTLKHVSSAEEYLGDHFPTFPVLPGVMTLECMVQAARHWAAHLPRQSAPLAAHHQTHSQSHSQSHAPAGPLATHRVVLGEVRALKYGALVRPGSTLRIDVSPTLVPAQSSDALPTIDCKGKALLVEPGDAHWALHPEADEAQLSTLPVAASGRFVLRAVRA